MPLFEKIIAREIPADIVYEVDLVLAFNDINTQAPQTRRLCESPRVCRATVRPSTFRC